MTDGRLHYDAEGREFKTFHVLDGYGIRRVMDAGIEVAVISGRRSQSAAGRIAGLGIRHVMLGRDDKAARNAGGRGPPAGLRARVLRRGGGAPLPLPPARRAPVSLPAGAHRADRARRPFRERILRHRRTF